MKKLCWLLFVFAAIGIAGATHADTVLLNDNFNSENGGIGYAGNYNGFANWTVASGNVDLCGYGNWDYLGTGGVYVDLDGSGDNVNIPVKGGTLVSKVAYNLTPGTTVLQFDLAGSQRAQWDTPKDTVRVKLGTVYDETFVLDPTDPLTTYARTINVTSSENAYLSFQDMGADNIGAFLDNVRLVTPVPEPATILFLGLGLLGSAIAKKRIRK